MRCLREARRRLEDARALCCEIDDSSSFGASRAWVVQALNARRELRGAGRAPRRDQRRARPWNGSRLRQVW